MGGMTKAEIAAALRKARLAKKMSQEEVARLVGVSQPFLRNVEAGLRSTTDERLAQIAAAVGLRYSVTRRLVKVGSK